METNDDERCAGRFWWRKYMVTFSPVYPGVDGVFLRHGQHAYDIASTFRKSGDSEALSKRFGIGERAIYACAAYADWVDSHPGLTSREYLGLPATPQPDPNPAPTEQPSEFARAVVARLAGWKGYDQGDRVSEEDAERYLTQEFVGAYNSMTWDNLADLAAMCEQLAIDRGLKPEGNS